MKKNLFLLAAAAICTLAACSKETEQVITEETLPAHLPGWTYIGAQGGEATKASIDGESAAFTWNTGDKIAVYSGNKYYFSADLAAAYDGTNSAEFAFDGDIDGGRKFFAVYPASLVAEDSDADVSEVVLNFPVSYPLSQVQGDVSPLPMIATNAPGGGLDFKIICPLLRILVKNISKNADKLTITFPELKVNGLFVFSDFTLGTDGLEGGDSENDGDDTITITDLGLTGFNAEGLTINIPVPTGVEYDNIIVKAFDAQGCLINYIVKPIKSVEGVPASWEPGRKSARKMTATLPVFTVDAENYTNTDSEYKYNTANPAFRKIVFSPGNLQAKLQVVPVPKEGAPNTCNIVNFGTASEWRFAEHQYTAIYSDPVNALNDAQTGDYIDLFAWLGNDATSNYIINAAEEYKYGIFFTVASGTSTYVGNQGTAGALWNDWGHNSIKYGNDTYAKDTWRTMTGNEWEFVLQNRMNNGMRINQGTKATLMDGEQLVARGLIILPDHYEHPYGVQELVKVYNQNNKNYNGKCSENVLTLADWAKMEDAGCIFLPLTNCRKQNSTTFEDELPYPADGWYWSTTPNSGSITFALAFNCRDAGTSYYSTSSDGLQAKKSLSRPYGAAVRLVQQVN